jgi:hypothetical protein
MEPFLLFQAQKRKLGLLEDDDISKLAGKTSAERSFGEGKGSGNSTGAGKNWGMFMLNVL